MTLKEQIEEIYLSTEGLEDKQSIETHKVLRIIKHQIVGEEYNLEIINLKDSRIARILEGFLIQVEKRLTSDNEILRVNAGYQQTALTSIIPTRLTQEELTTTIQTALTENPVATYEDVLVYLDDYFYDLSLAFPTYQSLTSL